MAIINLYPPILDTAMPGFSRDDGVDIYFSISDYNSIEDIENAQITITNQYNNLSALNKTKYPSEVMLKPILNTYPRPGQPYHVHIDKTDMNGEAFELNMYYKVQIRFTSTEADPVPVDWEDPTVSQAIDSWLTNNLDKFSEWSTVCLIRAIAQPTMAVSGFNIIDGKITWSMANNKIIGTLTFDDDTETDLLNNYSVQLYDSNNILLTDSGTLFSDNFNNFNTFIYSFQYGFEVGKSYYFIINYQTNTLYEGSTRLNFEVVEDSSADAGFRFTPKIDEENGRIIISLSRDVAQQAYTGSVVLRRTSDKSNFTIWEDLFTKEFTNVQKVKDTWYDMTIESGVWYKYALQQINTSKNRGFIKVNDKPLIVNFEDIFLTVDGKQLRIKFDPSVASFKQTISETKIDTIGSRYPFIRRNGAINYAQFPISGLISFQMDENNLFISDLELYQNKEILKQYQKYNQDEEKNIDYPITDANDFVKEKRFRDAVMKFLNNGQVKLFRSATEGNYLINLMDINFTPNQQLGRMVWNFSANAIEIAEDTIDNYELYKIIPERR